MGDLISRQELIDRCDDVIENGIPTDSGLHPIAVEAVKYVVENMPSVQQWKQWIPCSDLISRQSAFEVKVIPCKKCKWHGYLTCSNPDGLKGWVTDNDFCSYGEEGEFVRERRWLIGLEFC